MTWRDATGSSSAGKSSCVSGWEMCSGEPVMLKAEKRIRETIRQHSLIEKGDHIVVGLSGGPDSVCLFHVLLKLREELGLTIHPVHVNHQFRPGAAEADQAYVVNLCSRFGLETRVFTVDCTALAKELGMTSEEAGRKARYDAFCKVADEAEAAICGHGECGSSAAGGSTAVGICHTSTGRVKIAVAHNANDQAETVLFRILRGTGMDGLAGMAYAREERRGDNTGQAGDMPEQLGGTYRIVRPLLDVWREEIEEYCEANGLDPVTDHTNNEAIYTRNKIRLDLIPCIEENYNGNFREGLVRMAKIAAADKEYFWEETERAYARLRIRNVAKASAAEASSDAPATVVILDWRGLADCHEALRHRVVMKAFGEIGLEQDITAERLAAADKIILGRVGGKKVEFPHGHSLSVGKGVVEIV